jgi:hypothetical protein
LKLIIASIIVFSLVILFLFALFPSDISVSRIVQINKPKAEVRKKIVDLREWNSWNVIHEVYVQVDLLRVTPDSVYTRWRHEDKSFTGNFILTEMNGQTVLEWTLNFHIKPYPWDKLASMFYEKKLGPLMEESLINLQKQLEKPAG